MIVYDDAEWHEEGEIPEVLPVENAATHIGMYLAWCISGQLISGTFAQQFAALLPRIGEDHSLVRQLVMEDLHEKFTDELLNNEGNAFTTAYYEPDTAFAQQYDFYFNDYCNVLDELAASEGKTFDTAYEYENSVVNYTAICQLLDQRFAEWRQFSGE